ncbi:MAG: hypothetical protein GY710_06670 [Desulfobacteraceae bacterium]|nr:hypothetical protein [Desulfobacteraceae bacterium]
MLTETSNLVVISGYQNQQNTFAKVSNSSAVETEDFSQSQTDEVTLSRKASELQQVYETKETVLEQGYANEAQQLENEFVQEKNRLEAEYSQKKQALEIDLYV